jgi:protein-tyrosine phosphatase
MIDLHSHYLYAVDDGAKTSDVTLNMLDQAAAAGITRLLATPHVNEQTTPAVEEQIIETFDAVYKLLQESGLSLEIKLAAEVNMITQNSETLVQKWHIIGNEYKYLLVETPFHAIPANYSDILFQLRLKNITPIIAHPERNLELQQDPKKLEEWINQGCIVQVDAGSIIGQFGRTCQKFSQQLLTAGAIHIVSSDAHEPKWRNYLALRDAYHMIEQSIDVTYAQSLFVKNPAKIWEGAKLETTHVAISDIENSFVAKLLNVFKRL